MRQLAYNAKCRFHRMDIHKACWFTADDPKVVEKFCQYRWDRIAVDKDGNLVYLAETAWIIKSLQQDFPEIRFHYTSEFKREMAGME